MCIQVLGVPVNACAEKADVEEGYLTGMPCENPEQFERWYETYEQKTEQETSEEVDQSEESEGDTEDFGRLGDSGISQVGNESTEESAQSNEEETKITLYSFGDEMIPEWIQKYLYEALKRNNIEYSYELGLCQIFQESHGNVYAENRNGLDKGILQYRITYWDWSRGDIFSVEAQIDLYAEQMAWRFNQGLSVAECISRHKTSDYCTAVDWEYVQQVRQWEKFLKKVEIDY